MPDGAIWPWHIPVHVRIIGDFEGLGFGGKGWGSGEEGGKWVGEKACYFCVVEDGLWCAGWIGVYFWDGRKRTRRVLSRIKTTTLLGL